MPSTPAFYRAAARLASSLAPALALASPKLAAGHRGRHGAVERLSTLERRRSVTPLGRSSGCTLRRSARGCRRRACSTSCAAVAPTLSSSTPTSVPPPRRSPAGFRWTSPIISPTTSRARWSRCCDALRPDLLVFSKLDLWPELATRAAAGGTTVAMVAATVSPGSGRLRWPGASATRERAIEAVGAGRRGFGGGCRSAWPDSGVAPDRIRVLGDPRFDSVVERIAGVEQG